MTRLNILIYPHPSLRRKSEPVDDFNEETKLLANNMLETMYSGAGVGLASPQVGVNIRLLVIDVDQVDENKGKNPHIIFNPEIISNDGEIEHTEGCLSLPGLSVNNKRWNRIKLKYQDENGINKELEAEGLFSIAIQHEMDHLDGRLLLDYITPVQQDMYLKELKKYVSKNNLTCSW